MIKMEFHDNASIPIKNISIYIRNMSMYVKTCQFISNTFTFMSEICQIMTETCQVTSKTWYDISCHKSMSPYIKNSHIYLQNITQSCWKVGAQLTFLTLTWSIFDRFSKFFFPLKAYENCHFARKWICKCAPCAPASSGPA